jgi:glutamine synthetase
MLPISLESATARMMRPDSIARESGMLGDVFVDHFGGTREHEVKLWNEAVTSWEGMSWACCATDSSDFDVHVVERYIELA